MSMIIDSEMIEIYIPNSEAEILAQHVGIKDRTVGSYYMSESYEYVKEFFNDFSGTYYIDFARTYGNLDPLYDYIISCNKESLFKDELSSQITNMMELEESAFVNSFVEIKPFAVNDSKKYLKFFKDENTNLLTNLLLGDVTKLKIRRLGKDVYLIYGDVVTEYKEKIDCEFRGLNE